MPLYEYECAQCHKRIEKIQKFSDAQLTVCPHCGGALERTITAPAVHFAGGGWYKDGYGSAKPADNTDTPAASAAPSVDSAAAAVAAPSTNPSPAAAPAATAPAPAPSKP